MISSSTKAQARGSNTPHKLDTDDLVEVETHLIFCLLERAVDIIIGFPHSWHTTLIVPEPFLKVVSQFAEECLVRSLLVDLRSQG